MWKIIIKLTTAFTIAGGAALAQDAQAPEEISGTPASPIVVMDSNGNALVVPYSVTSDGTAILEGDIILGTGAELAVNNTATRTLQNLGSIELYGLFRVGNILWPKGNVPYKIAADLPEVSRVNMAIQHIQTETGIVFREATNQDDNYIEFVRPPARNNCSSSVGMIGGRQKVNLGDDCSFGNAVHEIYHALGVTHEQMRADRDNFVTVYLANVVPGMEGNFTQKPWAYRDLGPYCLESIMHYPSNAFARAPDLKTIVPVNAAAKIGQRAKLADCDIRTIKTAYAGEFAKR